MKIFVAVVIGVVVLGAVTQLVIPGFVERKIESNLEERSDGGEAVADVKAFPAVRLLWGSGDKLEVRGRGLEIDLAKRTDDPLGQIDGFDEVDIDLTDLTAGPVDVQAFSLVKNEDDTSYYLRMDAETTPTSLAESVGGTLGGDLGSAIAAAASDVLLGEGAVNVPIAVEAQVSRGDGGTLDVDAAEASVAGVPTGPFAEAMVQAVLENL
ncbi:MAG TPA: hypothetical protein VEW67_07005 [Thermoleophilaceae bacterium]|nr:hypothetical protein [Thermoleophilaceae bacterium]